MIEPESIPLFTGDLAQLEQHIDALRVDSDGVRQAGGEAHRQFQGLTAFYQAPEAEDLFASTAPARDAADTFADKVATVADALSAYAAEVAPIAQRLERLQTEAATFVAGLKTDSGAFDENWTDDADKVAEHQALLHEVNAAQSAFAAAEIACNNKITALVGGTQYVLNTGAKQLRPLGAELYGYSTEVLDQVKELPWGTPVTQSHDWWDPEDFDYYFKSFVWDGLIVDNIWGTVDGVFSLTGLNGGDQFKDSWEGLVRAVVGAETYLMESGGKKPEGVFATDFAQDSKVYAKEFAKSFVAWDMWGENPARAAATVVFNGLTLGVGPLKAASAGRAGNAAKVANTVAKVGDAIDPISATIKVTGHALPRITQVAESLRGVNTLPEPRTPRSVLEFADDGGRSVLVVEDGRFVVVKDGEIVTDAPLRERSVAAQAAGEVRERELAGVGARTGDDLSARSRHETTTSGSTGAGDTSRGTDEPAGGAARGTDSGMSGTSGRPGAAGGGTVAHGHGGSGVGAGTGTGPVVGSGSGRGGGDGGLDDLGRAGDETPDGGTGGTAGAEGGVPAPRAEVPRPSLMREGPNPYGPRGSLTLDQIQEIQVYRANHEPGYFERYYKKNGWRTNLKLRDESGYNPPQLVQLEEGGPWIRAKDTPAAPEPHFIDDDYLSVGRKTVSDEGRLKALDEAARKRYFAVQLDNAINRWKGEAGRAHDIHGTPETAAELGEARGTYKESHTAMRDATEEFGEKAAELHYIAERYPDFQKQTLLGPKNGNDQFDQVWMHEDGRIVVVEAKSSPGTELGSRALPSGKQVSQGSREYFYDILAHMEKRGEDDLVDAMEKALQQGKLEYVVVKGERNAGTYTGYQYRRFDISKGTLP
ncbi:hypothetical protein [Streptomyces sp. NPDC014995]|uniref:hypothetical protein n=1 Tax=Streptomyces sp. NPDC014995 TaxID=3364936 RepID=UPI0036F59F5C